MDLSLELLLKPMKCFNGTVLFVW